MQICSCVTSVKYDEIKKNMDLSRTTKVILGLKKTKIIV